jgi:hypothetical protein
MSGAGVLAYRVHLHPETLPEVSLPVGLSKLTAVRIESGL